MKKFFTLSVLAFCAFSMNAEITPLRYLELSAPIKVEGHKLPQDKTLAMGLASFAKARKAQAADEVSALDCFLGEWVHSQWCLDPDSYNDWIGSSTGVEISDNGDGTVTIKNILGYGDIQATFDADEEALVAPTGQFLFESRYGNVGLFSFYINDDDEVYFGDDDILFYVDDQNRFEILNDGIAMVLLDGSYAGYMLNDYYMFNQFDRVNATMEYVDFDGVPCSLGVAIDGTAEDGVVDVYGFGDVSCVTMEIDDASVSVPEDQSIFYYSGYGMYYIYPILEHGGSFAGTTDGPVEGSYDPVTRTITLASCCGYAQEAKSLYDVFYHPTITWNTVLPPVSIQQMQQSETSRFYDLQGRVVSKPAVGQLVIRK